MNHQISSSFLMPPTTCRLRYKLSHIHFKYVPFSYFFFLTLGYFNKLYVSSQTYLFLSIFSTCSFQSAAFHCICCHHVLQLETGLLDTIIIHIIIKIKSKIGNFGSQLQGCCQITNLPPPKQQ